MKFVVLPKQQKHKQLDIQLPGNEVVHFKPDDVNEMQYALSNKITSSMKEVYWNRPGGDAFENLTLEEFFDSYVVQHTQRSSTKSLQGSIFIPANETVCTKGEQARQH